MKFIQECSYTSGHLKYTSPVYGKESETLVEKWSNVALSFLDALPTEADRVFSKVLYGRA